MLSILKRSHYVLLVLIMATMPFFFKGFQLNNFFIILLVLNTILLFIFSKEKAIPAFPKKILLFISVYLIHIAGLLKSDDFSVAMAQMESKLSLLLFPILFFFSPRLSPEKTKWVLLAFVISNVFTVIYAMIIAGLHYFEWDDPTYFFYRFFSGIVGMQAIYLSIYLLFSLFILFSLYSVKIKYLNTGSRLLLIIACLILFISIVILTVRTTIFTLLFGSIIYFIYSFSKKIRPVKLIIGSLAIVVFIIGSVLIYPKNQFRFKEILNYKKENFTEQMGGGLARLYIWSSALEVIKREPLAGAGTGDVISELTKVYKKRGYTFLTDQVNGMTFNAHNQFLEITISLGFIGLFIFLVSLFAALWHAYKYKKDIYIIFLFIFITACLSESLLERQKGIIFFAFFNSFLFFNSIRSEPKEFMLEK